MLCTRVAWVCLRLCKKTHSPVSTITEMMDMGLYEVPLLGFGMGTMLVNFYMCGIMLLLRARFKHARDEYERAYVF